MQPGIAHISDVRRSASIQRYLELHDALHGIHIRRSPTDWRLAKRDSSRLATPLGHLGRIVDRLWGVPEIAGSGSGREGTGLETTIEVTVWP